MEDAQAALGTRDLKKTKEALDRGMVLLQERQKSPYYSLTSRRKAGRQCWNTNTMTYLTTKRIRRRFIERSQRQPERLSAPLHAHLSTNGNLKAKSLQLAASQLPNLFSLVNHQQPAYGSTFVVYFACSKPGH